MDMLSIEGLTIAFVRRNGNVPVVRNVDISIAPGQAVGLVGESGSGKSMTALAVMRLLPRGARILSGKVLLEGLNLSRPPRIRDDLGARPHRFDDFARPADRAQSCLYDRTATDGCHPRPPRP